MAKIRFFDALPAYFGGKRKLVKAIFKDAPSAAQAPVFADAFMGGGSVSLMAKALGYQVVSNDIARRSFIIGKALIENNKVRLDSMDISRLFIPADNNTFVRSNFCPEVFLTKHAEFLDNALAVVNTMEDGPKKYLSLLLLIKYVFYLRPYSKFSSPNAFNIPMEERRIEWIKNRTYHASIKAALKPIPEVLQELAKTINHGIIDNAKENKVYNLDVLEFLPKIHADIVYFDPPYAGTMAYEEEYHVLDQILEGQLYEAKKSEFSLKDGITFLDEVFHVAKHIPTWILSMGNAGGANECLGDLVDMIGKHKAAQAYRIKYKHMTGAASEEHKAKNEEYIIIGREK